MSLSQTADDGHDLGFMGGVLGQARRVLFRGGDVPTDGKSIEARTPLPSDALGEKKKKSRGARRARLAASSSSLANISSLSPGVKGSTVGAGSSKSRGDGTGKENTLPNSFATRRGKNRMTDSLAASPAKETVAILDGNNVGNRQPRTNSAGSRVHAHRRRSRSSLHKGGCSLSVCSDQQANGTKDESQHRRITIKSKTAARFVNEMDGSNRASGKDGGYELTRSSAKSLGNEGNYSMAEIESFFKDNASNLHKNRRRGRRSHHVSSLVQDEAATAKAQCKQGSGLSSLMALPSSIQKTQKSSSLAQKKAIRKKLIKSRKATKDGAQKKINSPANASGVGSASQEGCQSTEVVNVASLSNDIESLKIGDDNGTCSTPLTIRHRAGPGGITSPPGFLHRYSTVSSFFTGHSPMPDSNPNLKKRFDSRKTPDKMASLYTVNPMEAASPLSAKMSMSPIQLAGRDDELNQNVGDIRNGSCSDGHDVQDDFTSPRITIKSYSFISSPSGGDKLAGAISNLFSRGEHKKDDCAEEHEDPDDTSHVGSSPLVKLSSSSIISSPSSSGNTLADARSNLFFADENRKGACGKDNGAPDDAGAGPCIEASSTSFIPSPRCRENLIADGITTPSSPNADKQDDSTRRTSDAISSPSSSGNTLADARSNLFFAGKNRKGACGKDDGAPDDAGAGPCIEASSTSFIPSPRCRDNLIADGITTPSSPNADKQDDSTRRTSDAYMNGPGSAVIAVEAVTPRFVKSGAKTKEGQTESSNVADRVSAVMEVEIAAPITRKDDTLSSTPSQDTKKNDKKTSKKKNSKGIAETKEEEALTCANDNLDAKAEPPRRSSRQSKKTDRLTITSWKKKGNISDRKVRFGNSADTDESQDDHSEESEIDDDVYDEDTYQLLSLEQSKGVKETCVANPTISDASVQQESANLDSPKDSRWSDGELKTLRAAQKEINPTSTHYWQEVADVVGRTWQDCQMKWQSMVATPRVVRKATKEKDARQLSKKSCDHLKSGVLDSSVSDGEDEDDLFNSSPYREAELEDQHVIATQFSNSGETAFGLSPCQNHDRNSNFYQEELSALKFRRKGYNTYIENLRRDINRNRVEKEKKARKQNQVSNAPSTHIRADLDNGDTKMSGQLLPDGTIKINVRDESDCDGMDDIWGDEEDEE